MKEIFKFFKQSPRSPYTLHELHQKTNVDIKVLSKWRLKDEKNPLFRPGRNYGLHRRHFNDVEERAVAEFIRIQYLLPGFIVKRQQLCDLLFDCWKSFDLKRRGSRTHNFFTRKFLIGFCKRQRLSFRRMRRKRRSELDQKEVEEYAREFREVLVNYPLHRVINMDETPWNHVFTHGDVLVETGQEAVGALLPDDPRKSFTVIATIAADGSRFPPIFLAKGTTDLCHRQFSEMRSDRSQFKIFHSSKGYCTEEVMESYFEQVAEWMDGEECALILDRFSAHVSETTRRNAERHRIRLVFIPTSGTDLFQPLDIRVFGCLKSMAQSRYNEDHFLTQEAYTRSEAADLFVTCWYRLSVDVIHKAWNIADDDKSDSDENSAHDATYIDDQIDGLEE